jgi:hypothetical protein
MNLTPIVSRLRGGAMIVRELSHETNVDLNRLATLLSSVFGERKLVAKNGSGKERVRWAVVLVLGCSYEAAEELVNALIFRRQLVLYTDHRGLKAWRVGAAPARC